MTEPPADAPHIGGPAPRRAALAFVFVTIALDVLALGVIIPVLPKLIVSFVGGDQVEGAHVLGIFGTTWAAMQFIFSPLFGALSDRVGRRPIILMSNFGLGLDYVLMALAPSLAWLFVGRVVSGITAASISTAGAYIADVTPPEKRAASFGMMGAAFGLGFVLGPALGGILGDVHPRLPFWVAGGLSLANACYGLLVLPESLPKERRSAFLWSRANPVGAFLFLRGTPALTTPAIIAFISTLAHEVYPAIFVIYADHRYGWTNAEVGVTFAVVGVASAIVQARLVRPLVAKFGERRMLLAGLAFGALGMAVYAWAPTTWAFRAAIPLAALWGIAGPSVQGLMSRRVSASEQGRLQGVVGGLRGVSGLIGPGLFTTVFALFISADAPFVLPGAPFVVASALLGVAAVGALFVRDTSPPQSAAVAP